MVPFYFMTGANTYVPVESYSNAGEVKDAIFKKLDLNVQRLPYYCLYEICEKKEVIGIFSQNFCCKPNFSRGAIYRKQRENFGFALFLGGGEKFGQKRQAGI